MAHFLQRERYLDEEIPVDGIVGFDLEITQSLTEVDGETQTDFTHHTTGAIDVLRRGDYLIMWGLDQISDRPLATDFFQLRRWVESPISSHWENMGGSSTQLKAASAGGVAILSKTTDEPTTVALFNVSGSSIHLNSFCDEELSNKKARIVFFGLSEADGDFSRIMELIELDACCYPLDELADRIRKITLREEDQYHRIEDLQVKHTELSNEYQFLSQPPDLQRWGLPNAPLTLQGMYLYCKRVGYMYYLWIEGQNSGFSISPSQLNGYRVLPAVSMWMINADGIVHYPFRDQFPYTTPVHGVCWIYDSKGIPSEHQFRLEPPNPSGSSDTNGGLWFRSSRQTSGLSIRMSTAISLAP